MVEGEDTREGVVYEHVEQLYCCFDCSSSCIRVTHTHTPQSETIKIADYYNSLVVWSTRKCHGAAHFGEHITGWQTAGSEG